MCVELYTQTHGLKWNDFDCTGPRRYICEPVASPSGHGVRTHFD